MNSIKNNILLLICCTLLIATSGCISSRKSSGLTINVSDIGVITVANKRVALSRLPEKLDNMGIKKNTPIWIEIPPRISATTLKALSSTLASSGYRRIIFKKPTESTAKPTK